MSAKKRIKIFGKKALLALYNKFLQLRKTNSFLSIKAKKWTRYQKRRVLNAISLIKEKCDRSIKGRTIVNRKKHKLYKSKIELVPLIVNTDIFILSVIIDIYKRRDATTTDIKGVYLSTSMNELVVMKITNE